MRRTLAALLLFAMPGCRQSRSGLAEYIQVADERFAPQLLAGFYPAEQGWRWTGSRFAMALRVPKRADKNGAGLILRYSMPEKALESRRQITISPSVQGTALPAEKCAVPGLREMKRDVPPRVFAGREEVTVEFTIEPVQPPGDTDRRELGIIVHAAGLQRNK